MDFSSIEGVVTDMDGVLWRGNVGMEGLRDFFALLRERAVPVALATNNSTRSSAEYAEKLASMGVGGFSPDRIVTSRTALLAYLLERYAPGTGLYVIGAPGLRAMIAEAGYVLTEEAVSVVVGLDPGLTYDKLRTATRLIAAGADFLGTNADAALPMPDGLAPGAGSILAALETATGRKPVVMGKPAPAMFAAALKVLGTAPSRTLMIGDRIDTDILGGRRAGLRTALVLSGITRAADLPPDEQPPADAVFSDIAALTAAWREAAG